LTKVATVTGLLVSALTFGIYFLALGFALRRLTPITLGQFFATATVLGLAVGFGTQRIITAMKLDPHFQDWMVTVTYRIAAGGGAPASP